MAGVTERAVWDALVNAGFSNAQAAGIMGNMQAESSFHLEDNVIDSNGYPSIGLIQWNEKTYPNAGKLVTGHPQTDLKNQIHYLVHNTNNIGPGTQGSTATTVAGNFASKVEVCQGCQPGGSSWNVRRQYAQKIYADAKNGKWPSGKGSGKTVLTSANANNCPSWLSADPIAWAACRAAKAKLNSPLAKFLMDPVDSLERVGLVILGALLILVGVAILGFGPAMKMVGIAGSTKRDLSKLGGGTSGPSPAVQADRQRRLSLAEENLRLGQRNASIKERRVELSELRARRTSSRTNRVRAKGGNEDVRRAIHSDIQKRRAARAAGK